MTKHSLEAITVDITEIDNIQSLLLKTNYELNEIWSPDDGNEVQVWSNKKLKKTIEVIITEDNPIKITLQKLLTNLLTYG